MRFSLLLSLVLLSSTAWGKKYAVIFNGGDNGASGANVGSNGAILRRHFTELANQDAAFYRSQGYEVITVDANSGATAADFSRAISNLRDADQLAIGIFAHGQLVNGNAMLSSSSRTGARVSFPRGYLRQDEFDTRSGLTLNDPSNRFAYYVAGQDGRPNDRVGLGDLYDALAQAKINNPSLVTSINSLSCYGGNAIRALESIPDVQLFSASDTTAPSYMLFNGPLGLPSTRLVDYSQFLIAAQARGMSYIDAHLEAKRRYDDFAMWEANGVTTTRPMNSIEVHFADMCLGAPRPTELVACNFDNVPSTVTALARNVVSAQLHQFMSRSLREERRFWQGISASSCSESFDSGPMPQAFTDRVKAALTRYFDTYDRNPEGGFALQRRQLANWTCPQIYDCDFGSLESRSQPNTELFPGAVVPIPGEAHARALLKENCPLQRSANVPDSRARQFNCVIEYSAREPLQAVAMLAQLQSQAGRHREDCNRARQGVEHIQRLTTCLSSLSSQGDDAFWERMGNLLQNGQRTP